MKLMYVLFLKNEDKIERYLKILFILSFFIFIYSITSYYTYIGNRDVKQINSTLDNYNNIVVSGEIVGIKMFSKGVIVTGFESFDSNLGIIESPFKYSNIQEGDIIISINDQEIENIKHMTDIINQVILSENKEMNLVLNRRGTEVKTKIIPKLSKIDGQYKIGLWVKDSMAGLGTITFFDKVTKKYVALGHCITETKNNTVIPIWQGKIVEPNIVNIIKSRNKFPGEIEGTLSSNIYGTIEKNMESGIYGSLISEDFDKSKTIELASKYEIRIR